MVVRDPEVATLTRETARLVNRAELLYDDLVHLQQQIRDVVDRASDYADRKDPRPDA